MKKKLSINRLATGNLKTHKKRYTVLIIGIILAMIFSSGSVFFIYCTNSSNEAIRIKKVGTQDAISVNIDEERIENLKNNGIIKNKVGYAHVTSYLLDSKKEKERGTAVAWLDDYAREFYQVNVIEGRYPDASGEIAFEKTALARIDKTAKVGDKITVLSLTPNGGGYFKKQIAKTYTLVGILYDKRTNFEQRYDSPENTTNEVPAAFVSEKEQPELGGKENLVAFYDFAKVTSHNDLLDVDHELYMHTFMVHNSSYFSLLNGEDVGSSLSIAVFLSIVLTVGSCFIIVNSFSANLNERKTQIGMLRAVGATRRQIVNIFGREAFIICLICAPISILISYFGVWLFARIMGDNFIFLPNITSLAVTTAVGIISVMLAALLPLFKISRISPMQAIRNTEFMRKMKNKHIRSQKSFNASKLLAKRNLMFFRFRQVTVCLIIAITVVMSCLGFSYAKAKSIDKYTLEDDYFIFSAAGSYGGSYVNYFPEGDRDISESQKDEIALLENVSKVTGSQSYVANILFDGEIPKYFFVNGYCGADVNSPDREFTSFEQWKQSESYFEVKQNAGYTKNFAETNITAYDSSKLKKLEKSVIDGKINIDKLNSGEEIIVLAPEKIGYFFKKLNGNGWQETVIDVSQGSQKGLYNGEFNEKYVVDTAESCFKAGDEVTLSILIDENDSGNLKRYDKTYKIGAIVNSKHLLDIYNGDENEFRGVGFFTTTASLKDFIADRKYSYDSLSVSLQDECDADVDDRIKQEISTIFPNAIIDSRFENNERLEDEYRSRLVMLISMIILFTCICAATVNNSITAQVRQSKRAIGTLRAVGASVSDLTRCYRIQIFSTLAIGTAIGAVAYAVVYFIIKIYVDISFMPWIGLAIVILLFAVCFANLRIRIAKITKESVVDNIREL